MKKLLLISSLAVMFLFTAASCGNSSSSTKESPAMEKADAEVYYTCTMHPEVHESQPGKCPICGMDLVKRTVAMDDTTHVQMQMQN
jgi:Cu(I)/Ag(I) efflux system membrane fusion protein